MLSLPTEKSSTEILPEIGCGWLDTITVEVKYFKIHWNELLLTKIITIEKLSNFVLN